MIKNVIDFYLFWFVLIRFKSSKNSLIWAFVRLELNCGSLLRFKNITILKSKYQFLFRMMCLRFLKKKKTNYLSNFERFRWGYILSIGHSVPLYKSVQNWCTSKCVQKAKECIKLTSVKWTFRPLCIKYITMTRSFHQFFLLKRKLEDAFLFWMVPVSLAFCSLNTGHSFQINHKKYWQLDRPMRSNSIVLLVKIRKKLKRTDIYITQRKSISE